MINKTYSTSPCVCVLVLCACVCASVRGNIMTSFMRKPLDISSCHIKVSLTHHPTPPTPRGRYRKYEQTNLKPSSSHFFSEIKKKTNSTRKKVHASNVVAKVWASVSTPRAPERYSDRSRFPWKNAWCSACPRGGPGDQPPKQQPPWSARPERQRQAWREVLRWIVRTRDDQGRERGIGGL